MAFAAFGCAGRSKAARKSGRRRGVTRVSAPGWLSSPPRTSCTAKRNWSSPQKVCRRTLAPRLSFLVGHVNRNLRRLSQFPPTPRHDRGFMFEGFNLRMVELPEAKLRLRHGGSGPPVLLLHGHPRTHATWHRVAPLLATAHTVVCPDLRGFGQSSKPVDTPDHAGSSKRAKAGDCVALMRSWASLALPSPGTTVVAYSRSGPRGPSERDHSSRDPRRDPVLDALERCDARFAQAWWHWFFFAQPANPSAPSWPSPMSGTAELRSRWASMPTRTIGLPSTIPPPCMACWRTIVPAWALTGSMTKPTVGPAAKSPVRH